MSWFKGEESKFNKLKESMTVENLNSKLYFSVGLACLSSYFYVKVVYQIIDKNIINSIFDKRNLSFELALASSLVFVGLNVIYIASLNVFKKMQNKNKVAEYIYPLFYGQIPLIGILSTKPMWFISWIISTICWVILATCFFITIFDVLGIILKKYTTLENKEQFTIGVAIVTFILGLLLGK